MLDITFNASLFICIALSSPLFATLVYYCLCMIIFVLYSVGTVTAIPASIIVDFIRHKKGAMPLVYIGMCMILIGFIGFVISEFVHIRRERKKEGEKANVIIYIYI